jgi:hypothetical protein
MASKSGSEGLNIGFDCSSVFSHYKLKPLRTPRRKFKYSPSPPKAITGNSTPERKNVWKWIEVLDPDPELARLICHSLGYSTRQELEEAVAKIDALEKQE